MVLDGNDDNVFFQVDSITGQVSIKQSLLTDAEQRSEYEVGPHRRKAAANAQMVMPKIKTLSIKTCTVFLF